MAVAFIGCGSSGSRPEDTGIRIDATPDMCGDMRLSSRIYFGTSRPTALPLSEGQILAIGSLNGCTGIFISDQWILTADHCGISPGREFCVGPRANDPIACFTVDRAESHPQVDMTLLHTTQPTTAVLPEIAPVPIMVEALDSSWFGTIVEASGYGRQEDGNSGEREFTAEPLVDLQGGYLVIDGMGERGVCFGDSGGPVMGIAGDGTIRVLGDLSGGDPSCTGRDRFARTDQVVDWIESFVGPTQTPTGGACGAVTAEGQCNGNRAFWCEDEMLRSEECERCGWAGEGYRCLTGADPCEGITAEGSCNGQVAEWCDRGEIRRRDCGACGETCGQVPSAGGAYCIADPCAGLGFQGECRGDVARWCQDGTLRERDCGRQGLRCDFVNDQIGYFCTQ